MDNGFHLASNMWFSIALQIYVIFNLKNEDL
jgi:hypothetical protein